MFRQRYHTVAVQILCCCTASGSSSAKFFVRCPPSIWSYFRQNRKKIEFHLILKLPRFNLYFLSTVLGRFTLDDAILFHIHSNTSSLASRLFIAPAFCLATTMKRIHRPASFGSGSFLPDSQSTTYTPISLPGHDGKASVHSHFLNSMEKVVPAFQNSDLHIPLFCFSKATRASSQGAR